MISGILLAAGSSKRMGSENKLLLPFKEKPMFLQALKALQDSKLDELIVVLGHEYRKMMPYFNSSAIKLAINGNHLEGQTSSIKAGLQLVNPSTDAVLICLADMPLIQKEHIDQVIDVHGALKSESILKPYKAGTPGHPTIFSKSFISDLSECKDADGCQSVIKSNTNSLIKFETTDSAFFTDIDDASQYDEIIGNN